MQSRIVESTESLRNMTAEKERISTELDLAAKIQRSVYCETLPDVTAYLKEIAQPGDVILTVGAGDIYRAGEAMFR